MTHNDLCRMNNSSSSGFHGLYSTYDRPIDDNLSNEYFVTNEYSQPAENHSNSLCDEEEAELRTKLRWLFTDPFEKYRKRKLHPWKLLFQILKMILITVQILYFSMTQTKLITSRESLYKLSYETFVSNEGISKQLYFYTVDDLNNHINYVYNQYSNVDKYLFSPFMFPRKENFYICAKVANKFNLTHSANATLDSQVCQNITNSNILNEYLKETLVTPLLQDLYSVDVYFLLLTEVLGEKLKIPKKYCYLTKIKMSYENTYNNGELRLLFDSSHNKYSCGYSTHDKKSIPTILSTLLNIAIMILAMVSLVACIKSILYHYYLMRKVTDYFHRVKHVNLNLSEKMVFINIWIVFIIVGDLLAICGSILKIIIDHTDADLYQQTIILLGISCIVVWIGALRYLTYFHSYNVLLVIIKLSFPTLFRFLICVLFLFVGFTFSGYILLAPYHEKFRTLSLATECLFSLMIGDEIFVTFQSTKTRSKLILFASQIYLALFNIIFLYLVVTIFISIVCHYHEYHIETRNSRVIRSFIDEFLDQCNCVNCDAANNRKVTAQFHQRTKRHRSSSNVSSMSYIDPL